MEEKVKRVKKEAKVVKEKVVKAVAPKLEKKEVVEDAEMRVSSLLKENHVLQEKISTLKSVIDRLEGENKGLRAKNLSLMSQISGLRAECKDLQEIIDGCRAEDARVRRTFFGRLLWRMLYGKKG